MRVVSKLFYEINDDDDIYDDDDILISQGALIASALVLIQQTELCCPKVAKFREIYAKVIGDKHEDIIAKFGATLAQGILDAGK